MEIEGSLPHSQVLWLHSVGNSLLNREHWLNDTDGKTGVLGAKPVPVPLFPPQTPHRLAWDRIWASAVQLTTWDMARPKHTRSHAACVSYQNISAVPAIRLVQSQYHNERLKTFTETRFSKLCSAELWGLCDVSCVSLRVYKQLNDFRISKF